MNRSPNSLQHIAAIRRTLFTTPEQRRIKRMAQSKERIDYLSKMLNTGKRV